MSFFVLSVNTRSLTAKVITFTDTLPEAIEETSNAARKYVLKKNEPLLHRDNNTTVDSIQTRYYSINSQQIVHQYDVFKQTTTITKGTWFTAGSEKTSDPVLVRRFMYVSNPLVPRINPEIEIPMPPPPPPPVTAAAIIANAQTPQPQLHMPKPITRSIEPAVLNDLVNSSQFLKRKTVSETNSMIRKNAYPKTHLHIDYDDYSNDDEF
jgi:hypothetical protein